VHVQKRLLHQVLRSESIPRGSAQKAQQARRDRIVQLGERGLVAPGVALHGCVRTVKVRVTTTATARDTRLGHESFSPKTVGLTETFAASVRNWSMSAL